MEGETGSPTPDTPQQNPVPRRIEPRLEPVNGIVRPPVYPPPDRPGRRTNVLDELQKIVGVLFRRRLSAHFRQPVDAIRLEVPNYHTLIKRPMDLGTIQKRLKYNYYWQAKEALDDIELMFDNCQFFNLEGTEVHEAGKDLRALFYTLLARVNMKDEYEKEAQKRRRKRKGNNTSAARAKVSNVYSEAPSTSSQATETLAMPSNSSASAIASQTDSGESNGRPTEATVALALNPTNTTPL